MNTPNYPFDLTLARDCKWPLVTRDGRKAEVLKWDATSNFPLMGFITEKLGTHSQECWTLNGFAYASEELDESDLFLSSDLTDPDVRAAVQAAHEKLGRPCVVQDDVTRTWHNEPPYHWDWQYSLYALTEHLPAPVDPMAPGHNPDKLTVSQVGEGWGLLEIEEIRMTPNEYAIRRDHIQRWMDTNWNKTNWGGYANATYRTQLSREALAALDKPEPDPFAEIKAAHKSGKKMQYANHNSEGQRGQWWAFDGKTEDICEDGGYRSWRIAPQWKLPDAPAGKQWHRNDFTQADLPPVTDGGSPWRPLLLGEPNEEGDEHSWNHIFWNKHDNSRGAKATNTMNWYRTRRPLPSSPTFVPWDFESAPISLKVKQKNNGCKAVVYLNYDHYNWSGSPISFDGLFADFTHLDGSPCGMEVK